MERLHADGLLHVGRSHPDVPRPDDLPAFVLQHNDRIPLLDGLPGDGKRDGARTHVVATDEAHGGQGMAERQRDCLVVVARQAVGRGDQQVLLFAGFGRDDTAQGRRSRRVRPGEGVGSVSTGRIGEEAQAAGAAGPVVGVGGSPDFAGRGDCHVVHVVGRTVVAPVAGVGVCRHTEGVVKVVRTDRQGTDRRRGVLSVGQGSGRNGVDIESVPP